MADIRQIEEFMRARAVLYRSMTELVKQQLEIFQSTPEGADVLFRVESRVKSLDSIDEKIDRKRRKKKDYSLDEVEDIGGVRILCLFSPDVLQVIKYLKQHFKLWVPPDIARTNPDGRVERDDGYRAYHFILRLKGALLRSNPQSSGVKSEVQIMTVLEHSWAVISHDLIYKKDGEVESEYKRWLGVLSSYLGAAEEHSRHIKDGITKKRDLERKRKDPILYYYLAKAERDLRPTKKDLKSLTKDVIDFMKASEEGGVKLLWHLVVGSRGSLTLERLDTLVHQIYRHKEGFGISEDHRKLMVVLALAQDHRDLRRNVIEFADELILASSKSTRHLIEARIRKAASLRLIGKYDESAREFGMLLKQLDKPGRVADIKNEIAYSLAETGLPENRQRALQLVGEALAHDSKDPDYLDTKGYVLICLGKGKGEVESGQELCADAKRMRSEKDPILQDRSERFYQKHIALGSRRISELEASTNQSLGRT